LTVAEIVNAMVVISQNWRRKNEEWTHWRSCTSFPSWMQGDGTDKFSICTNEEL